MKLRRKDMKNSLGKKAGRPRAMALALAVSIGWSGAQPYVAMAAQDGHPGKPGWAGPQATGTDYYFPGVYIAGLEESDIPQSCFWKAWYAGNYFAYSETVPTGSGNNPETWVSYSPAKFKLPAGATLVMTGEFAHNRYSGIDTYSGPVPVDAISFTDVVPDPGSTNPYLPGANRHARHRSYTLKLVEEIKPGSPAPNTLYLRPATSLSLSDFKPELRIRSYFPDRGQDILGGVAYPTLAYLELADGSVITGEQNICRRINTSSTEGDLTETAIPIEIYQGLIAAAPNPSRAPAQEVPLWERFFTVPYSLFGLFLLPGGEAARAQIPVPTPDGGGGGSLAGTVANAYVGTFLSHETAEREIAVTYVKVSNTPRTFDDPRSVEAPAPLQAQYWSMCSNVDVAGNGLTPEGFPTGARQGMCHNDETVVLNAQRFTRIAHSQSDNRPWNATNECGWSWLNGGPGDNLGRPVTQLLMRPALAGEESFAENSSNVLYPGTEAEVMGDYLPTTIYMSRAEFEAQGCHDDGYIQPDGRPDLPAPIWGTENTIKPGYPALQVPADAVVPDSVFGILQFLGKLRAGA